MEGITFTKSQLKIFWGTFLATFVMVSLQYLGVRVPNIISPLAQKNDVFETKIRPRIDRIENTYTLTRQTSFVPKAHANSAVDEASAYAVIDYDSGNVIIQKNLDQQLPIASLTKIMTAVVALDLSDPHEKFAVTEDAASQIPTKIGIKPGEKLTLEELLNAALLTSANDAVQEIKDGIDAKYGKEVFVEAMNEKADFIGLKNSHFTNPQGFDNVNHYASVGDLAVLTHYALTNYPLIDQIVKKDYTFLPANADHPQFDLYNWNGLIGVYPGAFGVKIGNTDNAGKTTIVASERDGKKMIAIVLGAPDITKRDEWAADLLDMGFLDMYGMEPVDVTKEQLTEKYSTWQYWN